MSAISDKNLDGFERQDDVFEITTASHYLLWGKGLSDAADDLCLFEHRVGGFYVPIPGKKGSRVALDFVEYFKPDEYKNMRWYTERLIGLRVI